MSDSSPGCARGETKTARKNSAIRWAVLWRSANAQEGRTKCFVWHTRHAPALFCTRAEARAYIRKEYGFIATRKDLQAEPHGWRMPIAVRVRLSLEEVGS